ERCLDFRTTHHGYAQVQDDFDTQRQCVKNPGCKVMEKLYFAGVCIVSAAASGCCVVSPAPM
ncbi:hypothetical protein NDU88_011437, partial [Pleurodeles waltl]